MAILIALLLSFLMGLVIQRGGTCTVAAIQEVVHKGTFNRIKALIETSLWVLVGELILAKIGFSLPLIQNWQITFATFLGAIMLGLGAFINGACAVGTIARIGNREWSFLAMLPGFFCGAFLVHQLNIPFLAAKSFGSQSITLIDTWLLIPLVLIIIFRGILFYRKGFHPYVLTVLIGVFFLGLITIDKSWSYTDLLVDLALLKEQNYFFKISVFGCLLIGAIVSGNFQVHPEASLQKLPPDLLKRFVGGSLMGAATIVLPGSHDSLILLYMPMLLGYAWLGFTTMACTILALKMIEKNKQKK